MLRRSFTLSLSLLDNFDGAISNAPPREDIVWPFYATCPAETNTGRVL
jgi:hypothetical protein